MNWMLWVGIGCMIAGVLLVVYACMVSAKRADEMSQRLLERAWLDEHRNDPALHQAIEDYEDFQASRSDGGQDD